MLQSGLQNFTYTLADVSVYGNQGADVFALTEVGSGNPGAGASEQHCLFRDAYNPTVGTDLGYGFHRRKPARWSKLNGRRDQQPERWRHERAASPEQSTSENFQFNNLLTYSCAEGGYQRQLQPQRDGDLRQRKF